MNKETERKEFLRSVYEQHWLHARHVEDERLWFTNIYLVAVGGLLAYTFEKGTAHSWPWQILILVFIFSILGFFMCHHLCIPFLYHSRMADIIQIHEWQLPYHYFYSRCPKSYKLANPRAKYFPVSKGKDPSKFGSFSGVFHIFYSAIASFSVAFLLHDLDHSFFDWAWYDWWVALTAGLVCFGILYGLFYRFIFKNKQDKAKKYLDALVGKNKRES